MVKSMFNLLGLCAEALVQWNYLYGITRFNAIDGFIFDFSYYPEFEEFFVTVSPLPMIEVSGFNLRPESRWSYIAKAPNTSL